MKTRKEWSLEEILYLKANYKSYNLQEISKTLGREKTNVCRKAKQLGLDMSGKKIQYPKGTRDNNGVWHENGWVRKTSEEIAEKRSGIMKEWYKTHEHPKGMLGKHHSEEYKQELSKRLKKQWENMTEEEKEKRYEKHIQTKIKNDTLNPNKNSTNCYSRTKSGKRKDLNNQYFRSSWEANIARYYNFIGVKWEYEPKTFYFDKIRRGCISYTPDFYLPDEDKWIEVKGWMDQKSKTKLKRFEKYYPDEYKKLTLIGEKEYKEIQRKVSPLIKNWE